MSDESDTDTIEIAAADHPEGLGRPVASSSVQVDLGGQSHPGKVRPNNEDYFLAVRFERAMQTLLTNLPAGEVPEHSSETVYGMVVADGMGGEAAGEVASRTAIRTMIDLVLRTPDWIMHLDTQLLREVSQRMERRFRQIQEVLNEQARANPKLFGMGTTLTLTCSLGRDLLITHVGDSRAYLFRGGRLVRLTRDQTVVQSMVDAGVITPEQAATHPWRHRLLGALSTKIGEVEAEIRSLALENGDRLLLCTDGLTDMVPEPEIADTLRRIETPADACAALVAAALEHGGKDNVTVVMTRYHIPE